jgi:hypothetical protein
MISCVPFCTRAARINLDVTGVLSGSACVPRVGDCVLAIANFVLQDRFVPRCMCLKVRCGATPQPTRETRALPGDSAPRSNQTGDLVIAAHQVKTLDGLATRAF